MLVVPVLRNVAAHVEDVSDASAAAEVLSCFEVFGGGALLQVTPLSVERQIPSIPPLCIAPPMLSAIACTSA